MRTPRNIQLGRALSVGVLSVIQRGAVVLHLWLCVDLTQAHIWIRFVEIVTPFANIGGQDC